MRFASRSSAPSAPPEPNSTPATPPVSVARRHPPAPRTILSDLGLRSQSPLRGYQPPKRASSATGSVLAHRAPDERGHPGARWHSGHRGSQVASRRAMAMRAVMKESWKWRSGRERDLVFFQPPSGRGGKAPHTFGDDERVAAEDDGDVVMAHIRRS